MKYTVAVYFEMKTGVSKQWVSPFNNEDEALTGFEIEGKKMVDNLSISDGGLGLIYLWKDSNVSKRLKIDFTKF